MNNLAGAIFLLLLFITLAGCTGLIDNPEQLVREAKAKVDRIENIGDTIREVRGDGAKETLCERLPVGELVQLPAEKVRALTVFCDWSAERIPQVDDLP